jgi:hypothetical protein
MHDINGKIINLKIFCSICLFTARSVSVHVSIYLSIYQSFYSKQQITSTTTIFFRRYSRHLLRHCHRTITSNRRCTLEWCSMITVQGCWALPYLLPLFFFLLVRTHAHTTRLFPLSHPWLMSLVYWAKTKRHYCNRVKLVFVSFFFSPFPLLIFLLYLFSLRKDFEFLDIYIVNKLSQFRLIIGWDEYVIFIYLFLNIKALYNNK